MGGSAGLHRDQRIAVLPARRNRSMANSAAREFINIRHLFGENADEHRRSSEDRKCRGTKSWNETRPGGRYGSGGDIDHY